jgi:hypothetical protein
MKKCSTKTLPVPVVPWASSSLKKSCKHKSIQQLLGLIQCCQSEIKNKKILTHTLPVLPVPRGSKFIEKELQKQVHPSAAGPNPVSQK